MVSTPTWKGGCFTGEGYLAMPTKPWGSFKPISSFSIPLQGTPSPLMGEGGVEGVFSLLSLRDLVFWSRGNLLLYLLTPSPLMGEGGVEDENLSRSSPSPWPSPTAGRGELKKMALSPSRARGLNNMSFWGGWLFFTGRRENPILPVYHHPSFPNDHPSVIPECFNRESMPFQLPLDPW